MDISVKLIDEIKLLSNDESMMKRLRNYVHRLVREKEKSVLTDKQQNDIREGLKDIEKGNTIKIKNINNIWESIL